MPEAKIESSYLDGSYRQQLDLKGNPLGMPNHLLIDCITNRLYWSDASNDNIRYYDLDTGTIRVVINVPDSHIFGISIFQDYILWTDRDDKNGVHVAFLENGKKVRGIIHPFVGIATDIVAFTETSQPKLAGYCNSPVDGTDCRECGHMNGGCEQLCLANNGSQSFCECGLGFKLDERETICTSYVVDDTYLVVTDAYQKQLYQVSALSGEFNAIHVSTHYRPIAIDIDPMQKKVYWSDITSNVIKRVNLDGTYEEVVAVLSPDSVPDGIAVDYINRLLFYTDTGHDQIGVISMTNTNKSKVISQTTEEPRDIVVDPYGASIFWTDWGKQPMIEAASMDGSSRRIIVNLDLGSWPNGLAIDHKGKYLYWCDAKNNQIMSSDLKGRDVKVLYHEHTAHYFGIALMGRYIYLTDWTRRSIMRLDQYKPVSLEPVGADAFGRLNGIQAYNSSEIIKATSVCKDEDCQFLCIPTPNGWKACVCPSNFVLNKDAKTCSMPPLTTRLIAIPTSSPTSGIPTAGQTRSMAAQTSSLKSTMMTTEFTSMHSKMTSTKLPKTTVLMRKTTQILKRDAGQLHPGIIALIIMLCLAIIAASIVVGVYFYKRWHSDGRHKLVEDERVDSYYQIAFPESDSEGASLDSGIENPTYKYTMSELQASDAKQMANLA